MNILNSTPIFEEEKETIDQENNDIFEVSFDNEEPTDVETEPGEILDQS